MKKILYATLLLAAGCNSGDEAKLLTVEGTVKNGSNQRIYLEENVPNSGPVIMDSATLSADGNFTLKAPTKEEALYQLRLGGKQTPFALVINDVPKVNVQADAARSTEPYTVSGSAASSALINFDKAMFEKGSQLYSLFVRVDSLGKAKADSAAALEYPRLEAATADLKSYAKNFLQKSPSPVLTLYALGSFQNTARNLGLEGFSAAELRTIVNEAAGRFPAHEALKAVQKNMPAAEGQKPAAAVRPAPEFVQPGIDGKPVSLSSFRGKYVLVDFWASWCKPCRTENPNVVAAYNKFKEKNFTVFGVSLDREREPWQKAIQQDRLAWTHASDLKFWSNEAAALYGVQSIPANFLIDPKGNIIAQDLRGEELERTLAKLLP